MKKILKFVLLTLLYTIILLIILIKTDMIHIEFINPKAAKKETDEYIDNGLSLKDAELNESKGRMDRYYYNQLSENAQKIYNKILENVEEIKTGTAEIKFQDNEFNEVLNQENGLEILSTEYQNAIDALRYDNVNMFYIDFTKMALRTITYTRGRQKTYEVSLSPADNAENYLEINVVQSEINNMLSQLETKKNEILSNATGSNYQKIQYVHNWLIDNLEYDTTYARDNTRNIYGALIENEVVCEGYAKSFKYLLDSLEIPCILLSGEAINSEGKRENHMWNYVQINGIWYSVDVTWDDPILLNTDTLPESSRYKYFCQGDNINSNHFATNMITQGCQTFEYPELYHKEEI